MTNDREQLKTLVESIKSGGRGGNRDRTDYHNLHSIPALFCGRNRGLGKGITTLNMWRDSI
ncbi:hypothetical protein ASL11_23150 [Paenibacillus sp. Soil750]|nr:hypothetical protein ASL11_23150 [Paenibacillus sp. Soil750]